jgi:hypothetical protein
MTPPDPDPSDGAVPSMLAEAGVRDTIARYAHHVDDGEFVALSELFVADGELMIDRFDEPLNTLRGRCAIAEYLTRSAAERAADPRRGPYRRHHVSSVLVRVESAARATAESYFTAVMAHGVDHWGRYEDVLRLDVDRWRFEHRHVRVDGRRAV